MYEFRRSESARRHVVRLLESSVVHRERARRYARDGVVRGQLRRRDGSRERPRETTSPRRVLREPRTAGLPVRYAGDGNRRAVPDLRFGG